MNSENIYPVLQYRWKLDETKPMPVLLYYGLKNYPKHEQRFFLISNDMVKIIKSMDGTKSLQTILEEQSGLEDLEKCKSDLKNLIDDQVIVDKKDLRKAATADDYQTCISCVNNDYILPGLEFNEDGLCAFCQCYDQISSEPSSPFGGRFITDEELVTACQDNSSRFDVISLYTGGKDSSFLIWYLAKKLKLRVLACMWDMPFSNPIVYENLKRAKERLPEVEFLTRALSWDMTKSGMQAYMKRFGIPCICQIISYPLFYAVAANEKIPFIIDGVETAQLFVSKTFPSILFNNQDISDKEKMENMVFKKEQEPITEFEMFLEEGKNHFEPVFEPCKEVLKNAAQENLPQMVRFNTEDLYDTWNDIEGVISKELGWQPPPKQKGRLHTSCYIEQYKDYAFFQHFKQMKTMMMPQSIIEISAAIYLGQITREQGLQELSERGYYGKPECMKTLLEKLDLTESDLPYQCI